MPEEKVILLPVLVKGAICWATPEEIQDRDTQNEWDD